MHVLIFRAPDVEHYISLHGPGGMAKLRQAYHDLETRLLATAGRKAIRRRVQVAKKVGRKAVRAGLIAGTVAAVSVVVREVRKRA